MVQNSSFKLLEIAHGISEQQAAEIQYEKQIQYPVFSMDPMAPMYSLNF